MFSRETLQLCTYPEKTHPGELFEMRPLQENQTLVKDGSGRLVLTKPNTYGNTDGSTTTIKGSSATICSGLSDYRRRRLDPSDRSTAKFIQESTRIQRKVHRMNFLASRFARLEQKLTDTDSLYTCLSEDLHRGSSDITSTSSRPTRTLAGAAGSSTRRSRPTRTP